MSDLYSVIVLRRDQPGQVQMNFTSKGAALAVFDELHAGISERKRYEDGFGCIASIDPGDVGSMQLTYASGVLDYQRTAALMQARAQAKTEEAAKRDPLLTKPGTLVMPGPAGGVRQ